MEEKRYEKQIHKDGIRRTILTNTGTNTAKYFTKQELRNKVFVLGEEGDCEFLNKLQTRGFSYDEKKIPDHSYSSHDGVIGQSSHDIVYSLPENFYFDNMIPSSSPQPFSSPPSGTKWSTKNNKPTIMGRSQAVLSKGTHLVENKENQEQRGIKYLCEGSGNDRLNSSGGCQPRNSTMVFEKALSKAKFLNIQGKREQAVDLLMDLIDHKYGTLVEVNLMKVHDQMSTITNDLGWLGK